MYRRKIPGQLQIELPFDLRLDPNNRWVRLAGQIPWDRIEEEYIKNFKGCEGQLAKSARLAFGALYIQMSEGYTDEKTRDSIQENPYLQYFCGMECFTTEPPFDSSMMVRFRLRIPAEMIKQITAEVFVPDALKEIQIREREGQKKGTKELESNKEKASEEPEPENRGTQIVDATCCPQDIKFPTDIGLLNHARELLEMIIDWLYISVMGLLSYKPRTYRKVARKDYLAYAKTKKHTKKQIRSTLKKQLQYVARDLRIVDYLLEKGASLLELPSYLYKALPTIRKLYCQQQEMFDNQVHRCDDRIVSIAQPHVRPIVRGKENRPTEFGAKVAISLVGGYAFVNDISWDNVPEASLLPESGEEYKKMFGFYPEKIIGDRVYANRNNRAWCKERGIHLSGPRLGRKSEEVQREEAIQIYKDGCERNAVEGKFGVVKRKFSLDLVMTKLPETSETMIAMGFFVANMERKLSRMVPHNAIVLSVA